MTIPAAGPDLDARTHNALVKILKRGHRDLAGLRTHGMSAAGARAYIDALQHRADQEERALNTWGVSREHPFGFPRHDPPECLPDIWSS